MRMISTVYEKLLQINKSQFKKWAKYMESLFTEKETQNFKKKMLKLTSGQRNAYSNDIKLISTKMAKLEK